MDVPIQSGLNEQSQPQRYLVQMLRLLPVHYAGTPRHTRE